MSDPNVLFFCYLSRGFVQRHNHQIGMIHSTKYLRLAEYPNFGEPDAAYLNFLPNQEFTGTISFFQASVSQWYRVEYNLEQARLKSFPDCPSRLSAIYVFDSLEEAEKAVRFMDIQKRETL